MSWVINIISKKKDGPAIALANTFVLGQVLRSRTMVIEKALDKAVCRMTKIFIRSVIPFIFFFSAGSVYADSEQLKFSSTQIKIGYLVNFARYIRWPDRCFNSPESPVIIALDQSHPLANKLENRTVGQTKEGRDIVFQILSENPLIEHVHVLFFGDDSSLLAKINKSTIQNPVLTVGDANDFIDTGGVVQLAELDKNIIFYINRERAEDLGLNIHFKVLKMAKNYESRRSYD